MLYCSINLPHPPYECDPDTERSVSTDVILPEWFTRPVSFPEMAMHPYDAYMSASKGMLDEQGNFSKDVLVRNMRCWYAMCNQTDQMLGSVWTKAGETGNLRNTIVIFMSDHGEMHMEHRQHLKNSMFEGSSRVPLLIAGPGTTPGHGTRGAFEYGKVVKDLVSLVDLYPTFVDAAGGALPADLAGQSLLPYVTGASAPKAGGHVVSMYMANMANTNAFMIRKGPWKYIAYGRFGPTWYRSYMPQLFNLDSDPSELRDVAANNSAIVQELDALLRTVVDYDVVDREVKMEERMVYDRYFGSLAEEELLQRWQASYEGFTAADMQKVQQWLESTPSSPQPETPAATIVYM